MTVHAKVNAWAFRPVHSRRDSFAVALLSILVLVFFSAANWEDILGCRGHLDGNRTEIIEHYQLWRLLTSMVIHEDIRHLVSNSIPLGIFAFLLFRYFGPVAFPLLPLIVMPMVKYVALLTCADPIIVVGSSGIVFFIGAFWFTLYCFLNHHYSITRRALVCSLFAVLFLIPPPEFSGIFYRGHLIGAIFGFTSAVVYFAGRRRRTWAALRRLIPLGPEQSQHPRR